MKRDPHPQLRTTFIQPDTLVRGTVTSLACDLCHVWTIWAPRPGNLTVHVRMVLGRASGNLRSNSQQCGNGSVFSQQSLRYTSSPIGPWGLAAIITFRKYYFITLFHVNRKYSVPVSLMSACHCACLSNLSAPKFSIKKTVQITHKGNWMVR